MTSIDHVFLFFQGPLKFSGGKYDQHLNVDIRCSRPSPISPLSAPEPHPIQRFEKAIRERVSAATDELHLKKQFVAFLFASKDKTSSSYYYIVDMDLV